MSRPAAILLGVALLAAGCGGGARDELRQTADRVGKLKSGTLSFSLVVTPRGKLAKHRFGFRIHGPFRFGDRPTARVAYTQIANGKEATATLVLEPDAAYAISNGERRTLSAAQARELRTAAAGARAGVRVAIDDWIDGADSCGDHCVEGNLDVASAVAGLLGAAGAHVTLSDDDRETLADATKAASYRVESTDDHLLRELRADVDLGFDVPERLRRSLGDLVGARIDLRLSIANPRA
ncbi:MAG TPA: hypothetical protein VGJ77_22025 [Gaiellaceae bacterium]